MSNWKSWKVWNKQPGKVIKLTQLSLIINSAPRDLLEFVFFLTIGYTAGSLGFI